MHLLPNKYRTFASNLVRDVQDGMNKYFRGQALVAFCVGILFSIGFLIIDFPMAIALGLFIGALNMVPYLQIIGFFPTVLLAILKAADTGENFWIIIACALAVFAVVQIIQDTFLVPKIMGKITGLNPAIIPLFSFIRKFSYITSHYFPTPLYLLYNRFYFPFDFYEMSPNFLSIQKKDKTDHTLPCLPSSSIYGKSPI